MSPEPSIRQRCAVEDRKYLDIAGRIAMRGQGDVEPNPCVGCVIVKDGQILGMGHHRKFGGPHAERDAIASCKRQGRDPRGATIYVTLEPCAHIGKQPPCTEAIFKHGISRVVYARPDPHGLSGNGAQILNNASVLSECCDASPIARRASDPFIKRTKTGLPWVIAKWAQTIDGRIATRSGESQWISNELSRSRVHRLRSRVDVILTGLGTVIADDPMLNARGVERVRRVARRVIVDTHLETPEDTQLVQTASEIPTSIACDKDMAVAHVVTDRRTRFEDKGVEIIGVPTPLNGRVDLELLLRSLVDRYDATNVLVEAGPGLLGSMFAQDLVDEAIVYVAPLLLGDDEAQSAAIGRAVESLRDGRRFRLGRTKRLESDIELTYSRVRDAEI